MVYLIFIALQALRPFVALLLNKPAKVQRTDGLKVHLSIVESPWYEIRSKKLFTDLPLPKAGARVFKPAIER